MKPDVKVYYIDSDVNTEEIEAAVRDGYGVLPVNVTSLLVLVRKTKPKLQTFKEK